MSSATIGYIYLPTGDRGIATGGEGRGDSAMTNPRTAAMLGDPPCCHLAYAEDVAKEAALYAPKRTVTQAETIRRLWDEGWQLGANCAELGVTLATAYAAINEGTE